MGLNTQFVEVHLMGSDIKRYEELGYKIPKRWDALNKKWSTPQKSSIMVSVYDLPNGSHAKVECTCDGCGKKLPLKEWRTYINSLKMHDNKIYCHDCFCKIWNVKENNGSWDPNKTDEERINRRNIAGYINFMQLVKQRDNYTCQCCGKNSIINHVDICVHHINGFDWFEEGRMSFDNCITLCVNCHKNFHSIYGNGNNTKQQFEKWSNKTFNLLKEYNGILPNRKQIYCFETNMTYDNADKCAKELGANEFSVYTACNSKSHYCKGYHLLWNDYKETLSNDELKQFKYLFNFNNQNKCIICITTGHIFYSITNASIFYNGNNYSIGRACKKNNFSGKLSDGTKLQWMYWKEFIKLPKDKQKQILQLNPENDIEELLECGSFLLQKTREEELASCS